jgi:phosphatidate cytidylyltransferase
MSDDRRDDHSGEGFDDWLGDEPGPVTDPYKALASQDAEDENADWMEYTDQEIGEPGQSAVGSQPPADEDAEEETAEIEVVVPDAESLTHGDETAEVEVVVPESNDPIDEDAIADVEETATDDESMVDEQDETSEIGAVSAVDGSDPSGEAAEEDHDDTGELEIVSVGNDHPTLDEESEAVSYKAFDETDDTDELEPIASIGFGDLWVDDDEDEAGSTSTGTSPELFDISEEDYLHTATREHAGLAESMALADDENTEQVALAAPIPGLDSTVVGFEDVVEAEGHGRVRARPSGDLIVRFVTAVVLVAALGASLLWRPALVALVLGIFVLAAGEFYTALVRSGRKPIALFGFLGIVGASLGAFFFGALWIPIAFILATTVLLLFYAVVPGRDDPVGNVALTIAVMVWAGLGSFALLIANADGYRTLVFGVVATVAAMDIAQYFFGRALGRHKLAPWVSPKKTVEGLVAGVVVAMTVGALLHFFRPFDLTSGLAVGAAVAVFAPLGDLAMSAAKRSLGLKDMGSVLPGHGGFLDRIDGLLFVIPVAWAIFVWAGIL